MAWELTKDLGERIANGGIAVLQQNKDTSHLFWIGKNKRLTATQFSSPTPKESWVQVLDKAGHNTGRGGGIAAVSRQSDHAEVFWISKTGSLECCYRYGNDPWKFYTMQGTSDSVAPSSPVVALSKGRDNMEVFWIAKDGSVQGVNVLLPSLFQIIEHY